MSADYRDQLPSFRIHRDPYSLAGWKKILLRQPSKAYAKRETIIGQGRRSPHLYLIVRGLVEYTYVDEDGNESMIEILGEGNVVNLQPLFGNNPAAGAFKALTDCAVASIGEDEVFRHVESDCALARELIVEMAKIAGGLVRQLHIHTASAGNRLEQVLCLLAENHPGGGERDVPIPLAQEDLARITRTTRVTATKILGLLRRKKLVETTYGGIIVKDLDALKAWSLSQG